MRVAQTAPRSGYNADGNVGVRPLPAADILQAQPHQRQEAGDDQEELQHLVVNRAGETAEENVGQHNRRPRREMLTWKIQSGDKPMPNGASKICSVWISRAMAYIEMPEENTVMTANEMALKAACLLVETQPQYSGPTGRASRNRTAS